MPQHPKLFFVDAALAHYGVSVERQRLPDLVKNAKDALLELKKAQEGFQAKFVLDNGSLGLQPNSGHKTWLINHILSQIGITANGQKVEESVRTAAATLVKESVPKSGEGDFRARLLIVG